MKTIVVIPTYNEVDNLPALARELWTLGLPDLAILVVDDNSPDGTADAAERLNSEQPGGVHVMRRYVKGGKTDERWSFWRYLLSWWANSVYTRLILGTRTHDTTAGFKAWRRETLLGIDLDRIRSNGYDFQVEMAYVAERLGYRSIEIPIYFEDRRIGHSKMDIPVKIESALRVWDILWRHRRLTPRHRALVEPLRNSGGYG